MNRSVVDDYQQLKNDSGLVRLANHGVIELVGQDRIAFLNNYCTADLKKLSESAVTEAFILNEKGKCLLLANVVSLPDRLCLVFHDPSVVEGILEHLDKYLIREDVQLFDRSSEYALWAVVGPETSQCLANALAVDGNLSVTTSSEPGLIVVARSEIAGQGWLIVGEAESAESIEAKFSESGISLCSSDALEAIRVESTTPWQRTEVTIDNLPQELDRDASAISFTKGCYLGQETVARLDALGRVNWLLRGLQLDGGETDPPQCPNTIDQDGKTVAKITSVAWSLEQQKWLAIGFVRRGFEKPDSRVGDWSVR